MSQDTLSVTVADSSGATVASVESITVRPLRPGELPAPGSYDSLFQLNWVPVPVTSAPAPPEKPWTMVSADTFNVAATLAAAGVPIGTHADLTALVEAIEAGAPVPGLVVLTSGPNAEPTPGNLAAHTCAVTQHILAVTQDFLKQDQLTTARLVVITRHAVQVEPGEEITDLATATARGLLRSAQSEYPGKIVLLDLDGQDISCRALTAALDTSEPQLAVRNGAIFAARLAQVSIDQSDRESATPITQVGTALVTGATGDLGRKISRHLVSAYGVRRLLLVSRRGRDAEGAADFEAELNAMGADVTLAACDVANRAALEELLATLPTEHPLTTIVHTAGVRDDATIASHTPQHIDRVLRPKVDAAWNLHELTQGTGLTAFILFSSAAGLLGAPGQGNYAAANTFLDALAAYRHATGEPATSIAWGQWEQDSGITSTLSASDRARLRRLGFTPMSSDEGLAAFDGVLALGHPVTAPVKFDRVALHEQAKSGLLPPILSALIQNAGQHTGNAATLPARLAELVGRERDELLLEFVRLKVAMVLGHVDANSVSPDQAFQDLGFSSLAAIEFRNRVSAEIDLPLPATITFDYPTPIALAQYINSMLIPPQTTEDDKLLGEFSALTKTILSRPEGDGLRDSFKVLMKSTLQRLDTLEESTAEADTDDNDLQAVSDEDLFSVLDREFEDS
jgi:NAD(P)-dependent dehydrogenase (short-subunit alcohol dehydrogenase family)